VELTVGETGDLERAAGLLRPLGTDAPGTDAEARTLSLPTSGGANSLIQAARLLDDAGIPVADLALRRPSLDDVFLALTGHRAEADDAATDEQPEEAR
jgi:ABC-2 type transport system ATP-binding protein